MVYHRSRNSIRARSTTKLQLESLESRLLFSIDGLFEELSSVLPMGVGERVPALFASNLPATNSAPRIASNPQLASGTEVRGRSADLKVSATDDKGESKLTYTWSVVSAPTSGSVQFSINGTNKAKLTNATFSRSGQYQLRVVITDAGGLSTTSNLRVSVAQVATSLEFVSPVNSPLAETVTVQGKELAVRIRAFDQFNQPMTNVTGVAWSATKVPSGAKVSARTVGADSTLVYDRLGTYTIKANLGAATSSFKAEIVPVLTSIQITDANKVILTQDSTVQLATPTKPAVKLSAVGLDQFGNPMKTQPEWNWQLTTMPNGSAAPATGSGARLEFTADRVGSYVAQVQSGSIRSRVNLSVGTVLSRIELRDMANQPLTSSSVLNSTTTTQQLRVLGYDQFGQLMNALPALSWTATKTPSGGNASGVLLGNVATLQFSASGAYTIQAANGKAIATTRVNVASTAATLRAVDLQNRPIPLSNTVRVETNNASFSIQAVDQFGKMIGLVTNATWAIQSAPSGGTASVSTVKGISTALFNRAGTYVLRGSVGNSSIQITFQVLQKLTALTITPGSTTLEGGQSLQFTAQGLDQFGNPFAGLSGIQWTATGGTITNTGRFSSSIAATTYSVTAKAGQLSSTITGTLRPSGAHSGLSNASLRTLVGNLHADNALTRLEMIQILRSVGSDGLVSSDELADLRKIVGSNSGFLMPEYVRELAKDVVNSNPANARFRGVSAGNLAAGSNATLLNNLIDKWFLGADEPATTSSSYVYTTVSSPLFSNAPSIADAKQGVVGDCYFIASLTSIADENPSAITNMFLDNGDGTFTVRFYGATGADYVTVNRRLPTYGNVLIYAGMSTSIQSNAGIWLALAEKAYAQWNETGNSGRNGTNTYSGIEGGWMSNVNQQVLGFNSTNYSVAQSSESQLASSLLGGKAVTLGTRSTASGNWVGSHAYIVREYNSSTGRFSLYNPWGIQHIDSASWADITANCDFYAVTESTGSSAIPTTSVRSATISIPIGNWTIVEKHNSHLDSMPTENGLKSTVNELESITHSDSFESPSHQLADAHGTSRNGADRKNKPAGSKAATFRTSEQVAIDLAFALDEIETWIGSIDSNPSSLS